MSIDSNTFKLFENEHGSYLLSLSNPLYLVKRSQEGDFENIRCNITILFNEKGIDDFSQKNCALLNKLEYYMENDTAFEGEFKIIDQPETKLLKHITVDYIFDFITQSYSVKNIWICYQNEAWGTPLDKINLTGMLEGIATPKILPQVLFYIQSQYKIMPSNKNYFLAENSYKASYIDRESYNTFISMPKVKTSVTIDLNIIDYYTNFGAKELFFDEANFSIDKIDYKFLAYSIQNYLIDPINNRFMPGKKEWHYSNGKSKYSTPQKWQEFNFDDVEKYKSIFINTPTKNIEEMPQLLLIYALAYDKNIGKYDFSKLVLENDCLSFGANQNFTP